MPRINVNIAYQRMSSDSFDFLSHQDLQPEFYFSGDEVDVIEKDLIVSFREEVIERKFLPTVHAPFFDLNVGARDSQVCRVSFERLFWAVETANLLKADLVVVHPGYGPWILGHRFDAWISRAEKYLNKLCEHAASYGIKIAFENIYDSAPEDLLQLIERVGFNNAGICLDIGHFNVFSRRPLKDWLDILGCRILELHLHDNDGSADQHLAMGDGKIEYGDLFAWFKSLSSEQKPVLTLELPHRTHVIKSVNILRNFLS